MKDNTSLVILDRSRITVKSERDVLAQDYGLTVAPGVFSWDRLSQRDCVFIQIFA